ncbi:hypothetical protein ACFVGN_21040 [Streptomyces sp. NPDC057757]|uniref:hypothetical protein n=1 Tax=Streptomyces sp. NPDC057757 TaxID=3346241 RepID=UPI0036BAA7D9
MLLPLGAWKRMSASKVELYAAISRDHRAGLSMRALKRRYGVTWRTIRKALDSNWPELRKKQAQRPSRLDPNEPVIDEMLEADLDAPPKQKYTVKRIFDRLLAGHADRRRPRTGRAHALITARALSGQAGTGHRYLSRRLAAVPPAARHQAAALGWRP